MSGAPGRARRRLAILSAAAAGALAALTLLSVAPATAATDNTRVRPPDHTVVFGGMFSEETAPRDLLADIGDTVAFENHAALPGTTPVRITIGKDHLVVGANPVIWTAKQTVRYEGSYTMLAGPLHTITVPAPNNAPAPPAGGANPPVGPPAGSGAAPGAGAGAQPGAQPAVPAAKPVVPAARPGDRGYVPTGAGVAPMSGHRGEHADPMVDTVTAPSFVAAPTAGTHKAAVSGPSTSPLPVRAALAVFAGLMLVGVGSALARILFHAWLNAAPRTA